MWVSFWVIEAGFGMGRHAGHVTGVLRPPEQITAEEIRWNTNDPEERRKMDQWVKLGGYSLILWWAIIGGVIMTYLYSVAGLAYLHEDFLKTGKVPSGVQVPIQMATIAQGVMGPMAGWLMLLFIMVTLYEITLSAVPSPEWRAAFLRPPARLTTAQNTAELGRLGLDGPRVTIRTIPARLHAWLRRIDRWIAYANSVVKE